MNLLVLIILIPLVSFILLAFSAGCWSERKSAVIGTGSVCIAAIIAAYVGFEFIVNGYQIFTQSFWTWMHVGNFDIKINLLLDGLSLTMLLIVTVVGFLIHLFASWYMRGDNGYSRFFAYTNLFIAGMVILILADNLILMYFGWELVGLCSYLLIGFYYQNNNNGKSAIKAFIFTKIGDIFLLLALFILYKEFGTLNLHEIIHITTSNIFINNDIIKLSTLMLLMGAIAKSAQLPLQTWLTDAMVGPTPVSALIHSATMVTAGVYLITRTNCLFLLNLDVLHLVGIIGAVTLVIAGCAAIVQSDIKRILAYSTMSQIGYMFLALGVQAWNAAIFHLMTHAFFKALLFLATGSLILSCNHEQNIFNMGGLRKKLPVIYLYFLIGGSALTALPIITSGFYSKEEILVGILASHYTILLIMSLIGAFLTSIYTFRMIFIIFHGREKIRVYPTMGVIHNIPLIILSFFSTFIGSYITLPLIKILPKNTYDKVVGVGILKIISSIVIITGIIIAGILWIGNRTLVNKISNSIPGGILKTWWFNGWGFDWLYNNIIVKPYLKIALLLKYDPLNKLINLLPKFVYILNKKLIRSINGYLPWYIISMSIGSIILLSIVLII